MSEEKKLGLKETKEVYEFLHSALGDLAEHKADDGKVSLAEWGQTAMANAPAAVKAFMGADRVDDELKDLDEAELKEVATMGVSLMNDLMKIFMPGEAE